MLLLCMKYQIKANYVRLTLYYIYYVKIKYYFFTHLKQMAKTNTITGIQHKKTCQFKKPTSPSWWLNQPIWKICSSNWIISPSKGKMGIFSKIGVKIKNLWFATTQSLCEAVVSNAPQNSPPQLFHQTPPRMQRSTAYGFSQIGLLLSTIKKQGVPGKHRNWKYHFSRLLTVAVFLGVKKNENQQQLVFF